MTYTLNFIVIYSLEYLFYYFLFMFVNHAIPMSSNHFQTLMRISLGRLTFSPFHSQFFNCFNYPKYSSKFMISIIKGVTKFASISCTNSIEKVYQNNISITFFFFSYFANTIFYLSIINLTHF